MIDDEDDIRLWLREGAEDAPTGDPHAVITLAESSARRRRRRAPVLVAAAVAIVCAGPLAAATWSRVETTQPATPGTRSAPRTTAAPSSRLPIATSTWTPARPGRDARGSGMLRAAGDGCLYWGTGLRQRTAVVWPAGYTAHRTTDGLVAVRGPQGQRFTEGQQISAGGGFGSPPPGTPCTRGAREAFYIESNPSVVLKVAPPVTLNEGRRGPCSSVLISVVQDYVGPPSTTAAIARFLRSEGSRLHLPTTVWRQAGGAGRWRSGAATLTMTHLQPPGRGYVVTTGDRVLVAADHPSTTQRDHRPGEAPHVARPHHGGR